MIQKEYVTVRFQWEYFNVFPFNLALCYNVIIYSDFVSYPSTWNAWSHYHWGWPFYELKWIMWSFFSTLATYHQLFSPKDEFLLPTYCTPWLFFENEVILCIPFLGQIVQSIIEIISSLLLPPPCSFQIIMSYLCKWWSSVISEHPDNCIECISTIFTWMKDDSNLRSHLVKYVCQGKMYLSKSKTKPPKTKCLLRKNILLLFSSTLYTKHVRFYLTNQCHCLHLHI